MAGNQPDMIDLAVFFLLMTFGVFEADNSLDAESSYIKDFSKAWVAFELSTILGVTFFQIPTEFGTTDIDASSLPASWLFFFKNNVSSGISLFKLHLSPFTNQSNSYD